MGKRLEQALPKKGGGKADKHKKVLKKWSISIGK